LTQFDNPFTSFVSQRPRRINVLW